MQHLTLRIATRCAILLIGCLEACQPAASDADEVHLEQINATLQALNQSQARASNKQLDRMAEAFEHNGAADSDVLQKALALRARTNTEVVYLHRLRQRPGPVSSAAADTLRQRLRDYSQYVRGHVPDIGAAIGLDVKDDLDIQAVAGRRLNDHSFGQFYFEENTPTGSSAMLGLHEQQVLRVEHEALTKLAERMGPVGLFFDKIAPAAVAEAEEVRAGEPYRARLFLAAASPNVQHLRLSANGASFTVNPVTGNGQVDFRVPVDAVPGAASWQGTIQGTYRGRKVSFPLRVPYQIEAR
ncbi:hypothetical protein [Hymenobacter negativus]|uniref:Gliding motility-associated protein GldM first immunoglobulin-like domain-containing protein n=1 Tax=Hymenobacter negativus TaxID=2795026 RepID=A0ABS3QM77_9BACT|nr:hypothetical protein [Hymenobacter negativus]MBO2012317.1 hypothetical protein [Hymenobacter negativus]